jgi:hypothetical protein
MTGVRIATKTVPDLQLESSSTLLSAAEIMLIEVYLLLFRESASLRQQDGANKIAAFEKRREEGT